MHRREFLARSTRAAVGSTALGSVNFAVSQAPLSSHVRSYHVLGVPLRSGSLVPGNENDAQAYRDAHLLERLQAAGCNAADEGNLALPSYLPHHSVPPIRSWPGPRIVWDILSARITPYFSQPGHVPLLIGCDCSVVVGTAQALSGAGSELHVIYIDGDFDDAVPDAKECHSAAACAVWLLTRPSPFWVGPALSPSQVTVLGWSRPSQSQPNPLSSVSLSELRSAGIAHRVQQLLGTIPNSASILVHFDTDVLTKSEFPAAYFPHEGGMTLAEVTELLRTIMRDSRVRLLEISEYASLRDSDGVYVNKLVDLLCAALKA